MSNATGAVTYTLATPWTPSGSNIVPYVDENPSQPTITSNPDNWLSLVSVGTNQPRAVQVKRQGTDPSVALNLAITVVDCRTTDPVPLTPVGIVISKYSGRAGTFGGATISGNVITLTDLDNDALVYKFYVLFKDAGGNYGLLDPRLINQN